ncbi:hypothetical protein SAMN05443270_3492 [Lacrimispora sphenoides]|jgi:hypothetical protein|uniref:hypothetical protein n=1 Tax=Lacrimispora sphenoides TaxID=29370 RepID=UPI0008AAE538|nr:hypothetical protein [Lacrimispora sphenoides]SEU22506.1 hypothetical protein SAMN05443270_3492 [Lacrimispora sphenoides]
MDKNIDYIQQRRNRKKQQLRLRLGVLQMIHKPLLSLCLIPIVALAVFIWVKRDVIISLMAVPEILFPVWKYSISFIALLFPFLLIWGLIELIGNLTAQRDEGDIEEAFQPQDLRNGYPILMNKKRIKGNKVIMREFKHPNEPLDRKAG